MGHWGPQSRPPQLGVHRGTPGFSGRPYRCARRSLSQPQVPDIPISAQNGSVGASQAGIINEPSFINYLPPSRARAEAALHGAGVRRCRRRTQGKTPRDGTASPLGCGTCSFSSWHEGIWDPPVGQGGEFGFKQGGIWVGRARDDTGKAAGPTGGVCAGVSRQTAVMPSWSSRLSGTNLRGWSGC